MDISKRILIKEALGKEGKEIIIGGWAQEIRTLGKIAFIILRDNSGTLQITILDKALIKKLDSLTKESVILAKGKMQKGKQKSGALELILKDLEVLTTAEKLPIEFLDKDIETGLDKRLDYRYLDLRNPKTQAIFKIRSVVTKASEDFFTNSGFMQIHTPKILGSASESGANVFELAYFNKKAFLAQSPQFYKQAALVSGLDKVFEIGEVFRAEKHHTTRHLCEYTSLDFEIAFIKNYEDIMNIMEDLMIFILKTIKEECKDELKLFDAKVEIPKKPFPRITMREAKKAIKISSPDSEDLNDKEEIILADYIKKKYKHEFVFLTEFPFAVRPFYHMLKDKNTTFSFDLLYKGLEITTGAQREHRYSILKKQAKEKGVSEKDNPWYFEQFKYGVAPHGGMGTGIGRIVKQILNLENLRETVMFPRDPERISP